MSERDELERMLEENRAEVPPLVEGLTEEQARARLVPSLTTPLGVVRHLTFVERVWSQVTISGRSRAEVGLPEEVDDSFRLDDDDTVASVLSAYAAAVAESREVTARHDLDDVFQHRRMGPVTLRFVYLHLVRETARHAGHGDILREQLLAEAP